MLDYGTVIEGTNDRQSLCSTVECMSPAPHRTSDWNYVYLVEFGWAQSKRDRTLAERQIDFAAVTVAFSIHVTPNPRSTPYHALILRSP